MRTPSAVVTRRTGQVDLSRNGWRIGSTDMSTMPPMRKPIRMPFLTQPLTRHPLASEVGLGGADLACVERGFELLKQGKMFRGVLFRFVVEEILNGGLQQSLQSLLQKRLHSGHAAAAPARERDSDCVHLLFARAGRLDHGKTVNGFEKPMRYIAPLHRYRDSTPTKFTSISGMIVALQRAGGGEIAVHRGARASSGHRPRDFIGGDRNESFAAEGDERQSPMASSPESRMNSLGYAERLPRFERCCRRPP